MTAFTRTRSFVRFTRASGLAAAACATLLGTGCGVQSSSLTTGGTGSKLSGSVHGGQQPVSGAMISLYAAGASGNGVAATNRLLPNVVTTDANGGFSITGDYTCPSSTTQMYVVSVGGNPGLPQAGTNNPALVLMTALGDCGNLTSSTFISVNEVTTVAGAYALAQFLGAGAQIGASATNAVGLQNAFASVNNLVSTTSGLAPGPSLPLGATTEPRKLNTLANALAPCVNSDGTTGCAALFSAATVGSSVPTNTLDAALNIVRHPGANISGVFQAAQSNGPFQPTLSSAPQDWTLNVTYGNCSDGCGGLNSPGAAAIDSQGNVWVADYFGASANVGAVSRFSNAGVAFAPNGLTGEGLRTAYGLTVDGLDNAWIGNVASVTGANDSHSGSVSKFSSAGTELSGYGYTGGGVYYPYAVAADPDGYIWVADYGHSTATLLRNDGTAVSPSAGWGVLNFTSAVAIDSSKNAWFAVEAGVSKVTRTGVVSVYGCCQGPDGVAIDQSGNVWLADYGASAIVEVSSAGVTLNTVASAGRALAAQGIAIDGAGNVWAANYRGDSVTELNGATAEAISPAAGFGKDAPLGEPYGLAIDASGNVWVSNASGNTLTELVGAASPIRTPLLGPPSAP